MNKIIQTADGSNTLYNETIGEHYHSKHGALQESQHVFITAGLKKAMELWPAQQLHILEVGFGTGLNFLLSYQLAAEQQLKLNYTGIEAHPISTEELQSTAYGQYVNGVLWESFLNSYPQALQHAVSLSADQQLKIAHTTLAAFHTDQLADVIYYDAFSVQHQPEMWSDEIIAHTCSFLKPGGIFVTYAITGNLKRALKKAGLTIEKLPGAPGKREMLRAMKPIVSV